MLESSQHTLSTTSEPLSQGLSAQQIKQQKACLSALGVVVYEPLKQISLESEAWIVDVCELLNIPLESCVYDSVKPHFDAKTQTLHLPAQSFAAIADLKKSIWLSIRQFVA